MIRRARTSEALRVAPDWTRRYAELEATNGMHQATTGSMKPVLGAHRRRNGGRSVATVAMTAGPQARSQ
jgi:hypothetical protein